MGRLAPQQFGAQVPGQTGMSATGTTPLIATQIYVKYSIFSVVDPGAIAQLPGANASEVELIVMPRGGNDLTVIPDPGGQIENYGTDVGVQVADGESATFVCVDSALLRAQGRQWWVASSGSAPTVAALYNDGGLLGVTSAAGYPTTSAGAAGSIWSNGGAVSVVPGGTPVLGAPVFFGSVTAAALLALGGLGLPLTDPQVLNQLWNNGGEVLISDGAAVLFNNGGVLGVVPAAGYPTTSAGAPGSIWSNSGVVSVVAGGTPVLGAPVFFGSITPSALLALGALGLPTTAPTPGSLQLWVLNNEILVA